LLGDNRLITEVIFLVPIEGSEVLEGHVSFLSFDL
jgi:hypothetical protein